jgi:hypothetical protein
MPMKKRYVYSLLFGIPGFFVSLIISFVFFGSATGVLWIYGFGDNTWPSSINKILLILLTLAFVAIWSTSIIIGFVTGKKCENYPALNRKHILVSICATITPILFIVIHQLSVGNIGAKSDDIRCSDFCSRQGYSASGIPPRDSGDRSCSCFDNAGIEIIKMPIDSIARD